MTNQEELFYRETVTVPVIELLRKNSRKTDAVRCASFFGEKVFLNLAEKDLLFPIGKSEKGKYLYADLSHMRSLLLAGEQDSGVEEFFRWLIFSLASVYSPSGLKLVLIDLESRPFTPFVRLPHLGERSVLTDPENACNILDKVSDEIERRLALFEETEGACDLQSYNASLPEEKKLQRIVVCIAELAYLFDYSPDEVRALLEVLKKGSKAGVYFLLGTTQPNAHTVSEEIRARVVAKIAFRTSSAHSTLILGTSGAETLGQDEFLLKENGEEGLCFGRCTRLTDETLKEGVELIRTIWDGGAEEREKKEPLGVKLMRSKRAKTDKLYIDALRMVVEGQEVNYRLIQMNFCVGSVRATKILQWMEENGYISRYEEGKEREVLLSLEDFNAIYGEELSD